MKRREWDVARVEAGRGLGASVRGWRNRAAVAGVAVLAAAWLAAGLRSSWDALTRAPYESNVTARDLHSVKRRARAHRRGYKDEEKS